MLVFVATGAGVGGRSLLVVTSTGFRWWQVFVGGN